MTLNEARWRARRLARITGQPAVIYRSGAEWEVWHTLDAAKWLCNEGELVLPRVLFDPDEMERRLRLEAARLRGRARLKLLEAAFWVRCQRPRRSAIQAVGPERLAPTRGGQRACSGSSEEMRQPRRRGPSCPARRPPAGAD